MEIPLFWVLIGMLIGGVLGFILCMILLAMATPPGKEQKIEKLKLQNIYK